MADDELKRREEWTLFKYRPMEPTAGRPQTNDQKGFHNDPSLVRVIKGPNRGGKTICKAAEDAALLLGPPYPPWFAWGRMPTCPKPPLSVWLFMPQFPKKASEDARLKKLFFGFYSVDPYSKAEIWMPPFIPSEMLINPAVLHSDDPRVFEIKGGAVLSLKSDQQDVRAAAGDEVHLVDIDEPASNSMFYELVARLRSHPGSRMIYGLTDATEDSMTDHLDILHNNPNCKIFYFIKGGNYHEDEQHSANVMSLLPEEQQRVRDGGEDLKVVRRIYADCFAHCRRNELGEKYGDEVLNPWGGHGNWIPKEKCFDIPDSWTRYVIHDPGTTNPSATVWFAVDPDGEDIYGYRCLFFEDPPADTDDVVRPIFDMSGQERIRSWTMDPKAAKFPQKTWGGKQMKGRRLIDFYNLSSSKILGRPFRWALAPPQVEAASRTARIAALSAYFNPFNQAVPNLWLFEDGTHGMGKVRYEFEKYRKAHTKGEKTNNPEYAVAKNDNSVYCCEVAALVGLRHFPDNSEIPILRTKKYRQRPINDEMDRFMEGDGYQQGEWI